MGIFDGPQDKETKELIRGLEIFARFVAKLPDNWPEKPAQRIQGNPGSSGHTKLDRVRGA